jgi:hypothetical protein
MPSTSKKQQRLMGAALGAKRGAKSFPLAQKLAGSMTSDQLKDFATGPVEKPPPKAPKPKSYLPSS